MITSTFHRAGRRERGATLIIALLFLIVMTLFAVTTYNSSTTNMRVTGNMVTRQEALAAAQAAIDEVISDVDFTTDPDAVAPAAVDIDGDADTDLAPVITPAPDCHRMRIIKTTELDPASSEDVVCFVSGGVNSGVVYSGGNTAAGNSLCANTEWNIRAVVTDNRTDTQIAVNQGVGVRVIATDAATYCE